MENKYFYSVRDLPKTEVSPSGSKIYEWDYADETGAIKHDKRDVYSEIQSYKNSVDYKKLITQGVDINGFGFNDNDYFGDVSNFPGNYADYCDTITNIADNIDNQIANIQNGQSQGEVAETVQQGSQTAGESATNSEQTAGQQNNQSGGNN